GVTGRVGRDRHPAHGDLADAAPAPGAIRLASGVHGDPLEPGVEALRIADLADLPPRRDERVLGGVAGIGLVAEDRVGQAVDGIHTNADELLERVEVALAGSVDERQVSRGSDPTPSSGDAFEHLMPVGVVRFIRSVADSCPASRRHRERRVVTLRRMPSTPPLNPDYERRSFWQATMPALADRTGRPLPDSTDVVVIGGGYAGTNAARELARRGVAVTLLEAHTLGWGASTRNGGIVHAGYQWSAPELIKRYGADTGRALYRETLDSYQLVKRLIADEAIDCDFREVGHLELAYAPAHLPDLERARDALATVGVAATIVPRARIHEEIGSDAYYGALAVE